ncbi:MAG: diguanylate cyclase (GGDEF)-like protein [Motiliproteus sp.]|jgi:diguanylate cyclase (GGDEF)-like protein
MINVHAPTVFLVIVAVNVTLTLALAVGGSASNRDGLRRWSSALALHTLAFVIFGLRDDADDFALTLIAATTLSASWAMFAEGLFQFQQRPSPRGLIWLPVFLITAVFFLFQDNIPLRISVVSAVCCTQALLILVVLYQCRRSTVGRGQYFVAVGLAPVIPVFAVRSYLAATGQADTVLMSAPTQVQALHFLTSIVATLLVVIGVLIMSKERSEERSRLLAVQDQLTGLANRRCIDETLSKEWARANRHGEPLSLIMLDVDFFKKYNDYYGHQAGDDCLKDVAQVLLGGAQRANDLVARYGGEEFLLILPNTDADTAQRLTTSLCASVERLNIPHQQSPLRVLTLSAGIATLTPNTYSDAQSLLRAADEALYQAKKNGRNQARSAPTSARDSGNPLKRAV